MARFTSIGMPKRAYVASAANEAQQPPHVPEAGPSSAPSGDTANPKKRIHRAGKKLTQKRERAKAIANGEIIPEPEAPKPAEGEGSGKKKKKDKKRKNGPVDEASGEAAGEGGDGERRGKKRKAGDNAELGGHEAEGRGGDPDGEGDDEDAQKPFQGPQFNVTPGSGWGRDSTIAKKAKKAEERAEQRRLERIEERAASTVCFGCRATGHTARDCPEKGAITGNVCYRCNSSDHSLSQCRKPVNPDNPTPYANCFICNTQGHLSSQCPSNEKGVYVNGGKCNKCGSVRHRAGECREGDNKRSKASNGPRHERGNGSAGGAQGKSIGADEDDFMLEQWNSVKDGEKAKGEKDRKKQKGWEKKGVNNNGLREVYKKAGAGGGAGFGASGQGLSSGQSSQPKKVVAF